MPQSLDPKEWVVWGKLEGKKKTARLRQEGVSRFWKGRNRISRLKVPAVQSPQESWTLGNGTLSRRPAHSAKHKSGSHPLPGGHGHGEREIFERSMVDYNSPEAEGSPNNHWDWIHHHSRQTRAWNQILFDVKKILTFFFLFGRPVLMVWVFYPL